MTSKRSALIAFTTYFLITISKGLWLPSLEGLSFWMGDVFCFVILPLVLIYTFRLPIVPKCEIGSKKPQNLPVGTLIYLSVILFLGIWLIYNVSDRFSYRLALKFPDTLPALINYTSKIPKTPIASILVVIYFALTAGFVEEYIFRGILNNVIAGYLTKNSVIFIVISTISFAAIHWAGGLRNMLNSVLPGLIFAVVFVRTRDVRVTMLAHTLFWLKWLF